MPNMKKLLLIAAPITAIVIVGGGAAVASHYNKYQTKKEAPVATISLVESDKKVAEAKTASISEYQALVVKYNAQVAECVKGKAAYDVTTAFTRTTAKLQAPKCQEAIQASIGVRATVR